MFLFYTYIYIYVRSFFKSWYWSSVVLKYLLRHLICCPFTVLSVLANILIQLEVQIEQVLSSEFICSWTSRSKSSWFSHLFSGGGWGWEGSHLFNLFLFCVVGGWGGAYGVVYICLIDFIIAYTVFINGDSNVIFHKINLCWTNVSTCFIFEKEKVNEVLFYFVTFLTASSKWHISVLINMGLHHAYIYIAHGKSNLAAPANMLWQIKYQQSLWRTTPRCRHNSLSKWQRNT